MGKFMSDDLFEMSVERSVQKVGRDTIRHKTWTTAISRDAHSALQAAFGREVFDKDLDEVISLIDSSYKSKAIRHRTWSSLKSIVLNLKKKLATSRI